uniref:Uncharacterized protein n=1 Tax=Sphaerodactylus townsendi TaxID=933632 RepID=A0ACB8F3B0_9SAUR
MQDVTVKSHSIYAKRSQSKMRRENNLKRDEVVQDTERDHHINKNFLSVDIQGVLGDLQVESVTQSIKQETDEDNQNSEEPVTRSPWSTKKKSDELAANNEPQVTCKKCHYDTDEVRQYMVKQQRERKKKRSEQKKAQKEATEQKNRRLQELYKKQREALANKPRSASAPKLVPKQLLETDSKLLLNQALPEEPQSLPIQDIKPSPGYHPSEDYNNEDKMQEHPPNASFGSNMSPCESHHSLIGSHSKAVGSLPLAPITSTLLNQYKSKLDRIKALKATAASLSSRIESEAKRFAGICTDYRATWNSGPDLVQGNQGDGDWAKASSPPVREENDVFSARLQDMLSTCMSQLDSPGVGKTISPQATAVTLPCKQTSEGVAGNPSKTGSIIVPYDSKVDSISEQWLGDHLLSEEEGDQHEHSPLKTAGALKEKESWVEGATGNEPAEQFQKEVENYFPISAQIGSAAGPWEEVTKGSPHSAINTKSNPLHGKGFEEWSEAGSPKQRPSLPVMSPPTSIVSYEDDFISSQGSEIMTVEKTSAEPSLPDKIRLPRAVSCPQSPSVQKQLEPVAEQSRTSSRSQATVPPGLKPNLTFPDVNLTSKRNGTGVVSDFMHISPTGLQHQVLADLKYLSSIEEALQQLLDMEQVQDISLVQQKMVSLAQIQKAQQEQHERDLAFLMLRAEQEAVKSQRRLEEPQQKAPQAHAESLLQLVQSREDIAEAVETVCEIAGQQTKAALLTADTTQETCKLTEIVYVQNPDAVTTSANPVPFPSDQKQKHHSASTKKVKARSDTSSNNNSHQERPIVPFSKEPKKVTCHEKPNRCPEEEILTAVNNSLQSIPSIPDERDSTSLATEYSLRFDSMTEDEIEEKPFRSLLPSESHCRINLRKQGHHAYSDEEDSSKKKALSPVKASCQ